MLGNEQPVAAAVDVTAERVELEDDEGRLQVSIPWHDPTLKRLAASASSGSYASQRALQHLGSCGVFVGKPMDAVARAIQQLKLCRVVFVSSIEAKSPRLTRVGSFAAAVPTVRLVVDEEGLVATTFTRDTAL